MRNFGRGSWSKLPIYEERNLFVARNGFVEEFLFPFPKNFWGISIFFLSIFLNMTQRILSIEFLVIRDNWMDDDDEKMEQISV